MNALFDEVLEVAGQLSPPGQERLAAELLDAAMQALIDEKLAASERSFEQHGGRPLDDVRAEMKKRYGV